MSETEDSEEETYEVEAIVGHKDSKRHGRKYEIKWKGYEERTFEPRGNLLPSAKKLLRRYDRKNPFKSREALKKEKEKIKRELLREEQSKESLNEETDSDIEVVEILKKSKRGKITRKTKVVTKRKVKKTKKVKKKRIERVVQESSTGEYAVEILLKHRDTVIGR